MPRFRSGFTLVEMLVVLMIMGLLAGLVSAIVRPDARQLLWVEAERLAQVLDLAAEESRLSGRPIAFEAERASYRFSRRGRDAEWLEIRDLEALRARSLPQGIAVAGLRFENMPQRGAMRLEFAPRGMAHAFTLELENGTDRYAIAATPVGEFQVLPATGGQGGDAARK